MNRQKPPDYKYRSTLEDDYIRLLRIRNTPQTRLLEIELVEQRLSVALFEALSYAWGIQPDTEQIICNGFALGIGINLHAALCERRRRGIATWLWADAICINQANDDEKTRQVRVMRDIYASAKQVIIWLGPGSSSDPVAYMLAEHLFSKCNGEVNNSFSDGYVYEDFDCVSHGTYGPFARDYGNVSWEALFAIVRCPWFSRIWVLQELFVAKACVMWKGCLDLNPDIILWVARLIGAHRNLSNAFNTLIGCPETSQLYAGSVADSFKTYKRRGAMPIYQLLHMHSEMQATDPRDRLFALVGISSEIDPSFINYNKSLSEVASLVGKMAILGMPGYLSQNGKEWLYFRGNANDHMFQLEWLAALSNPDGLSHGIPSWLPDLITIQGRGYPMRQIYSTGYDGNKKFQYGPQYRLLFANSEIVDCIGAGHFSTEFKMEIPEFIHFRGSVFDAIRTVARPRPPDLSTLYFNRVYNEELSFDIFQNHCEVAKSQASLLTWLAELRLLADPTLSSASFFETGDSFDAFWRTLVHNRRPSRSHRSGASAVSPGFGLRFRWWIFHKIWMVQTQNTGSIKDLFTYKILSDQSRPFEIVDNILRDARNFFVSRNGRIGWVPLRAQEGDSICIFKGSCIPFVLRAREDGWEIIGAAYVHGCMDGEMWSLEEEEWEWLSFV